ncbi:sterile alpha motif domain-containing protein 9-like [Odontesthes bonariensis]|uniref:sterile alpha motif domain-containing protein 9-like n=1 Tax=Odontesthes bonariensis TaxID=219752 RepID=UPI003F583B38
MERGQALSTACDWKIYVGREIRDSLSLLDVLHANQCEDEVFDSEVTEENFYRGAPPIWLNFYICEQAASEGNGDGFITRDGYETLKEEIEQKRKLPATSTVKLFHQPGCGGTTMAMQVLWDLRKTFRCAVLTGSSSDVTKVAKEVVHLFTAGTRDNQNTVLLLLNDEDISDKLQDSILKTLAEQNVGNRMPVVIILNCVRKDAPPQSGHVVLHRELSDAEKLKFSEKTKELDKRYGDKTAQFHGFNIMKSNFPEDYIKQACTVFSPVRGEERPEYQLAAILSLLNAYVPGSYLLECQCLEFFTYRNRSVEKPMQPFGHLIVTFQQDTRSERKVRMAHPMIAMHCTELMAKASVARSDTARILLDRFSSYPEIDEFPQCVLGFVNDMLTKREMKTDGNSINSSDKTEEKKKFSKLILDIQVKEGKDQSASVLKVASEKCTRDPFFPQALARFCYIELKKYDQAEIWAKEAKKRDPKNSFIADTLGQVYKNQLNNTVDSAEGIQLAQKAIEAFRHEEKLAEDEQEMYIKGDGTTKVSKYFNCRGLFGFLQVCKFFYKNHDAKIPSLETTLRDRETYSLRAEVERKCDFFDRFLTYSKPSVEKDDPTYISEDASECHKMYVGNSPPKHNDQKVAQLLQKLKQKRADTSVGILACLDREYPESELKEITTWWEELCSSKDPETADVNYILACIMLWNTGATFTLKQEPLTSFRQKIPLSETVEPEQHMLALLLHWPSESKDKCLFDLNESIRKMRCSYEHAYKKHLRSRYLRPLLFLGKGQDLSRIVHRKILERLFDDGQETNPDWSHNWRHEIIFKDSRVQARLLKVEGAVQNYKVYATVGGKEIQVEANLQRNLWRRRQVSFYLGFTIKGPVAFGIQTKTERKVSDESQTESNSPKQAILGEHFLDCQREALIARVHHTNEILDKLLHKEWIPQDVCDDLRNKATTQEQMENILRLMKAAGRRAQDALLDILRSIKCLRPLMAELHGSQ